MNRIKFTEILAIVLTVFLLAAWGIAYSQQGNSTTKTKQQESVEQKPKEAEQETKKVEKEDDVGEALGKRMAEGESLFKILGIPEAEDYMPNTFDLVLLWTIPFSALIGIVILVIIITKRRNERIMAMIEKGITPDEATLKMFRPKPFRWDLFSLLMGLVLILGGLGVSLFQIGKEGIDQWYVGIIPLLIGVAFIIAYRIFLKEKEKD
jgi:sorbitol-specific phosphotransferase system component IIBC